MFQIRVTISPSNVLIQYHLFTSATWDHVALKIGGVMQLACTHTTITPHIVSATGSQSALVNIWSWIVPLEG